MRRLLAAAIAAWLIAAAPAAAQMTLLLGAGPGAPGAGGGGGGGYCNGDDSTLPASANTYHLAADSSTWVIGALSNSVAVTAGFADPSGGTGASQAVTNEGNGGSKFVSRDPIAMPASSNVMFVACVKGGANVHWLTLFLKIPFGASYEVTFDATATFSTGADASAAITETISEDFGQGAPDAPQLVYEGGGWFRVAMHRPLVASGNGSVGIATTTSATPGSSAVPPSYFIGSPNFTFFAVP